MAFFRMGSWDARYLAVEMALHFRTGRVGHPPPPHNEVVNQEAKRASGGTMSQASTLVACAVVRGDIVEAVGVDLGCADHLYIVI
jgi:hypothetical protein